MPSSLEAGARPGFQPTERVELLLRDLRSSPDGLSHREAERRLIVHGPNQLQRRGGRRWPRELAAQFTHPLALLLWVAAGLALVAGIEAVAIAIVVVIEEGARVSADARLLSGAVDVDMSALTGESEPVLRSAELADHDVALLD